MDYREIVLGVRDLTRCLDERGQLKFPIPVTGGLLPLVRQNVISVTGQDFEIDVHRKDVDTQDLLSVLLRYKNRAEIHYARNLNTCWARFAICKELTHLYFDTDETFTVDYKTLAQGLLVALSSAVAPNTPHSSEKLCAFGAIELLMPWRLRQDLLAMFDKGISDRKIAEHCRVPEQLVSFLLRSDYRNVSAKIHMEIDEHKLELL